MGEQKTRTQPHGCCYWFTGLPGAGKTTLVNHLHQILTAEGIPSHALQEVTRCSAGSTLPNQYGGTR